jgi:hypothetical protein
MAGLTQQQLQAGDAMINSSFNAVGAPAPYLTPSSSVADMYRNIITMPSWGAPNPNIGSNAPVGSPYMTPQERALLERQIAESRQLQSTPPATPPIRLAEMFPPPLPRPRPGYAPTRLDATAIAAIEGALGQPGAPPELSAYAGGGGARPPSNGAPGGLSSMFVPNTIRGSSTGKEFTVGSRYGANNGYIYEATPTGFRQVGRSSAGTPAEAYAAANSRPGSVSAMEAWHGGGSSSPQSGGPAVGGDYGGGGSSDGPYMPPKWKTNPNPPANPPAQPNAPGTGCRAKCPTECPIRRMLLEGDFVACRLEARVSGLLAWYRLPGSNGGPLDPQSSALTN